MKDWYFSASNQPRNSYITKKNELIEFWFGRRDCLHTHFFYADRSLFKKPQLISCNFLIPIPMKVTRKTIQTFLSLCHRLYQRVGRNLKCIRFLNANISSSYSYKMVHGKQKNLPRGLTRKPIWPEVYFVLL